MRRSILTLVGAGAVLWGAVSVGWADDVAGMIGQLGSGRYADRAGAEALLMQQDPRVLSEVEEQLSREKRPEVRVRLMRVAVHLYLKSQTHFDGNSSLLGISLVPEVVTSHVSAGSDDAHREGNDGETAQAINKSAQLMIAVDMVKPGFPVAEVLRVGDRIVAVDGQRFALEAGVAELQTAVRKHLPGGRVRLTLFRDGRETEVLVLVAGVPAASNDPVNYVAERMTQETVYRASVRLPERQGVVAARGAAREGAGE